MEVAPHYIILTRLIGYPLLIHIAGRATTTDMADKANMSDMVGVADIAGINYLKGRYDLHTDVVKMGDLANLALESKNNCLPCIFLAPQVL